MAAFMLDQAIEITLYGLITALMGRCPKTHYFRELKKPLKRCAPELTYIVSPSKEEESRLLLLLEKAYFESRYSASFSVSDNDVSLLKKAAEALHEKVGKVFKDKVCFLRP